jgi:hypothetical protein
MIRAGKAWLPAAVALFGIVASIVPALAQMPAWADHGLLAKSRAEGALTVCESMNEREAQHCWKHLSGATGIKVDYVQPHDTGLLNRIAIESRACNSVFDAMITTGRVPLRKDATPDSADRYQRFGRAPIITVKFSAESEKKWKAIALQLRVG